MAEMEILTPRTVRGWNDDKAKNTEPQYSSSSQYIPENPSVYVHASGVKKSPSSQKQGPSKFTNSSKNKKLMGLESLEDPRNLVKSKSMAQSFSNDTEMKEELQRNSLLQKQ